jgi:hypothetical protein
MATQKKVTFIFMPAQFARPDVAHMWTDEEDIPGGVLGTVPHEHVGLLGRERMQRLMICACLPRSMMMLACALFVAAALQPLRTLLDNAHALQASAKVETAVWAMPPPSAAAPNSRQGTQALTTASIKPAEMTPVTHGLVYFPSPPNLPLISMPSVPPPHPPYPSPVLSISPPLVPPPSHPLRAHTHPPPPPPNMTTVAIVERLNDQWRGGSPSNRVVDAGVLVRQFDTLDDTLGGRPWLPCRLDQWCRKFGDRWATSIINSHIRHLYFSNKGGFVLSDTLDLLCIHADDGNSMAPQRTCETLYGDAQCIPGCYPPGQQCSEMGRSWSCSYPPSQLSWALQAQQDHGRGEGARSHNEVVVDLRSVTRSLPGAVLAVFYLSNSPLSEVSHAMSVHRAFLRAYGHEAAGQIPLLALDLGGGPNGTAAFSAHDGVAA